MDKYCLAISNGVFQNSADSGGRNTFTAAKTGVTL